MPIWVLSPILKQQLREVNALKVNYTTYEGDAFNNLQ